MLPYGIPDGSPLLGGARHVQRHPWAATVGSGSRAASADAGALHLRQQCAGRGATGATCADLVDLLMVWNDYED